MPDRLAYIDVLKDDISRPEALRRLLATTELPVRLWSPGLWFARLKALLGLLWAVWREPRR